MLLNIEAKAIWGQCFSHLFSVLAIFATLLADFFDA
jgi:hypothetical protein